MGFPTATNSPNYEQGLLRCKGVNTQIPDWSICVSLVPRPWAPHLCLGSWALQRLSRNMWPWQAPSLIRTREVLPWSTSVETAPPRDSHHMQRLQADSTPFRQSLAAPATGSSRRTSPTTGHPASFSLGQESLLSCSCQHLISV